MTSYYNEIDPFAAQWLRNLIDAGEIAFGHVDTRSIEDVTPNDLAGYTQCHFFAGLGGWSLALRLAGWPDDRPVWTGSCPCQPFSAAGKGAGFADERHLWPTFYHLIEQCHPATVFGEQVASKAADPWIDLVHADLEAVGYAFGSVPFPSASVGAPHIRDRNYWMADTHHHRLQGRALPALLGTRWRQEGHAAGRGSAPLVEWLADAECLRLRGEGYGTLGAATCRMQGAHGERERFRLDDRAGGAVVVDEQRTAGPVNGQWATADWLFCRDGKWRPVESGTFPLAHGIPGRVGRLRAYGNAINPWQAAAFIEAYLDGVEG